MATYDYVTPEEMLAQMEEDEKFENSVANQMIILTETQQKIYDQVIEDGHIDCGEVGQPMTEDVNTVVDYLAENHIIELEVVYNDVYGTDSEGNEILIEQKPQTITYLINDEKGD